MKEELDIPVFHDDQHGTAVVVLAALLNAHEDRQSAGGPAVVVIGLGAAGVAVTKILMAAGVPRHHRLRLARRVHTAPGLPRRLDEPGQALVRRAHEPRQARAEAPGDALDGADLFIGLSGARHRW